MLDTAHPGIDATVAGSVRAARADIAANPQPFIARFGDALAESLDLDTILGTLVRVLVPALADACRVHLLDNESQFVLAATTTHSTPTAILTGRSAAHAHPMETHEHLRRALAGRRSHLRVFQVVTPGVQSGDASPAVTTLGVQPPLTSCLSVPLVARGTPVGVLELATVDTPAYDEAFLPLADALGRRAALALDHGRRFRDACAARARLETERGLSEAILNQVADGIMVADCKGIITYVNPSVERILGWKPEQLLGRSSHGVLHVRDEAGTRFPRSECPIAAIYQTGTPIHLSDQYFIRADGTVIPVALTSSPLFQHGRIVGGVTAFRDASIQRESRRILRQSEERLRRALSSAGMTMWEHDFATGRTYRSDLATTLYGRPNEELKDDPFPSTRLIHPDDHPLIVAAAKAAIERGEEYDVEFRAVWPDGSVRWLSGRAAVFYDEQGNARGLSGTTHDITERKAAREELRRLLDERQSETAELRQVQRRLERSLTALLGLHAVGKLLTSTPDLHATGGRLLEIAAQAADLHGAALRRRDARGRLRLWRQTCDDAGVRAVWKHASIADARRRTLSTGQPTIQAVQASNPERLLTVWCMPLLVKGQVIGVLEAVGEPRAADELTEDILGSIALQAATALDNARLYREVADSEQALRRLVHQLMTAQEDERRRLANDIHDGFAQLAAGAQQVIEAYAHRFPPPSEDGRQRLDLAIALAGRTVTEIRHVLAGLRPSVLDDFGLEQALRSHAASLEAEGLCVTFSGALGKLRLDPDSEMALFRVAQEALTNVQKHAGVGAAELRLHRSETDIVLEISDHGCGFDAAMDGSDVPGEQLGLLSMAERMWHISGTLTITSERGKGTHVRATVPVVCTSRRCDTRRGQA